MDRIKDVSQLPNLDIHGFKLPTISFSRCKFPSLQIGDITASIPIVQGGMGVGISLSGLASAVSREGGIGVIAANAIGMLEPDFFTNGREANVRALRKELRRARAADNGIIGVNIMVAANDFYPLLQVCIEEKADLVFLGAGLPIKGIPVAELRAANVKVVPIVSSHRAAELIFKYWQKQYQDIPDAVVVEGPLAGGHLGFSLDQIDNPEYKLEKIVPKVVASIDRFEQETRRKIPVIAAGGIFDGEDIYRFFKLGARGVQMGSRFVATDECDADRKFKESYIACNKEDIVIIQSPVGLPGRAIKGRFFQEQQDSGRNFTQCAWKCLKSCDAQNARYCIALALNFARKGNLEKGFAFAGANAYKIEKIVPVKTLIESLREQFVAVVHKESLVLRREYDKAVEKLSILKKEYSQAVDRAAHLMKKKYEHVMAQKSKVLREEYQELIQKIEAVRNEYIEYVEKLKALAKQLSLVPVE